MKKSAAAARRSFRTPLGKTPLAELKTGDLLAIADEEVIEPDTNMDGDAVGIIIDMLVMLDEPDRVLLHPSTIPPIMAPTYQINPVSFQEPRNFFLKNTKSKYLKDSGASNDGVVGNGRVALGQDDVALSRNTSGDRHCELATTVRGKRSKDRASDCNKRSEDI